MTTLADPIIKTIIHKLLKGQDYRIEIVKPIDEQFLQSAIGFFQGIAEAKLKDKNIDLDWYKSTFLASELAKGDIATNAGLNIKTITNMYGTSKKEKVIEVSNDHYDSLKSLIDNFIQDENDLNFVITLKLKGVSVDLDMNESLIVINALAVKRAALRGGLWSTVGKTVEKPLMTTLCKLYAIPESNYSRYSVSDSEREVDFFLLDAGREYKCEVKLMGKGNPESADGALARKSDIFVADTLSDKNKTLLEKEEIHWVELRDDYGFRRFKDVLTALNIPHSAITAPDLDAEITRVLADIFS